METKWLQVSLIHYPVNVLGIGNRVGVWTQGCSLQCKGCMSMHTWDFNGGEKLYFDELLETLKSFKCKKITISGGEPFEQKYFLEFLKELRNIGFNDIFVYSGFELKEIQNSFSTYLKYIDAIVVGRFIQGQESELLYKGSDNQEMIILNKSLYDEYMEYKKLKKDKKLQKIKSYIIGIPYQKDLEKLKEFRSV